MRRSLFLSCGILVGSTLAASAVPTQFGTTGRYFEVVGGTRSASSGAAAAAGRTFTLPSGVAGVASLARVDSAALQAFIRTLANNAGVASSILVGGTTTGGTGNWSYSNGTQFWQGGASGSAVGGAYSDWSGGTPTNITNGYLVYNRSSDDWFSLAGTNLVGSYVVEFTAPIPLSASSIGLLGGLAALAGMARIRSRKKAKANA